MLEPNSDIKPLPLACIFDLDGVIVDTARYHYQAWKRLASELGVDFIREDNEKLKGVSRLRSLEMILAWGALSKSPQERERLAQRKNEWYLEMVGTMKQEELLPGAFNFIQQVKSAGIKVALGSASRNSGLIMEQTGLVPFFDAIVDGNMVSASKPDPEVFLTAAQLVGVEPSRCVVFEDAVSGVGAARAACMKVVGIGSADVLGDADLVITGLHEMTVERLRRI